MLIFSRMMMVWPAVFATEIPIFHLWECTHKDACGWKMLFNPHGRKLKHIGRKWCSIPLDFRAELILKSAEMTEIGKTLVSPSQLICMDSKTRDILSISVISADLRIKSARKSSGMEHHLRPLCCNNLHREKAMPEKQTDKLNIYLRWLSPTPCTTL